MASSALATGAYTPSPVDNASLVLHADIFILVLGLVFLLLALPRAVYRLSRFSEWRSLHFLRSATPDPRSPTRNANPFDDDRASQFTVESHSQAHLVMKQKLSQGMSAPPARLAAWSTYAPSVAAFLRYPVVPGISIAQCWLLTIYFAILVYATLYKSNPFNDPLRAGFVAMAQLPIVIALALKNNPAGMMMGLSYERLNYIHRWAGRLTIIIADMHAIGYLYKFSAAGTVNQSLRTPFIAWGFVAVFFVNVLGIFSTSYWRERWHNVFKAVHVVSMIAILITLHLHAPGLSRYIVSAALMYALDRCVRLLKTRLCFATLSALPAATHIEVRELGAGWRAGQHVRLRVLSARMGWLGWSESHTFTVASAPGGGDGMVLMAAGRGTWTRRLGALARAGDGEKGAGSSCRVLIEGPYGGVGHTVFAGFSGAVLFAGGSGITFALAMLRDLALKDAQGASRLRVIELVWSVQDPMAIEPFLPQLAAVLGETRRAAVRISVFYTRAITDPSIKLYLPPGVTLSAGRPRVRAELNGALDRTVAGARTQPLRVAAKDGAGLGLTEDGSNGAIIAVCGPAAMCAEVQQAVDAVGSELRAAVGGVELHQEFFGF